MKEQTPEYKFALAEKNIAIATSVIVAAEIIKNEATKIPKQRGNPFALRRNRRPMKKGKTALAICNIAFQAYMSAAQVSIQMSKPIPKYPEGGKVSFKMPDVNSF